MSGDTCRTKNIEVEVQENGIIRDSNGWSMARLDDDYPFEDIVEIEKKERLRDLPYVPGFIIGGAAVVAFVLGVIIGHMSALSGFGV